MPFIWRSTRTAALAALALVMITALAVAPGYAQDDNSTVVIQGSQQLEALMRAIRDAYVETAPDADVQIDPQGPSRGFDALCSGEADLVMATAPIEESVASRCAQQGQDFIETVLAYQAVVLLAPTGAELSCIDRRSGRNGSVARCARRGDLGRPGLGCDERPGDVRRAGGVWSGGERIARAAPGG